MSLVRTETLTIIVSKIPRINKVPGPALVQGTVASSRSVHPSTGVRSQHPTAAVNQIPAILKLLPNLAALKPPETSKIVSELPYLMLTYLLSLHILSLSLSLWLCMHHGLIWAPLVICNHAKPSCIFPKDKHGATIHSILVYIHTYTW